MQTVICCRGESEKPGKRDNMHSYIYGVLRLVFNFLCRVENQTLVFTVPIIHGLGPVLRLLEMAIVFALCL